MENTAGPIIAHHRYKWTLEERIVLTVLGALIIGTVVVWAMGFVHMALAALLIALFAFMFGWGIHVGGGRKKKSALTGSYDPETMILSVTGNKLDDKNAGSLRKAKTAGVTQVGPNSTLVINLSDGKSIQVPQRIGKPMKEILLPFLEKRGYTKDAAVQTWVDGLETYNR